MDFWKLGNLLMIVGAIVLIGALLWWYSFYSSIFEDLARLPGSPGARSVLEIKSCIYSNGGVCALISGAAAIAGKTVYEPMVFWLGLAGLIAGAVIRLAAKPAVSQ